MAVEASMRGWNGAEPFGHLPRRDRRTGKVVDMPAVSHRIGRDDRPDHDIR
ncbi:MAG: hypothetical protein HOY76_10085 [Streptomyces sp.]|nr:hypothetical protein [Streptomyces sp.]